MIIQERSFAKDEQPCDSEESATEGGWGKTLLKVLLRWLLCYVGKGKGTRRTVITESVSVGDLGQEGRKERIRTLLTVCVARENHTGADRKIFLCAALFLTPKRFMNTCPRRELCQSS